MAALLTDNELHTEIARIAELGNSGDYEAFNVRIHAVVARCRSASQLWALAESDPFYESAFGEEGPTLEIVLAVLARARAFADPGDVAMTLALANRMLAIHPGMTVLDDDAVGRKAQLGAAADEVLAFARDAAASRYETVRIAAAHALGCASAVEERDTARLAELARDKHEVVSATALLSLAAVCRRLAVDSPAVEVLAGARRDGASPLFTYICAGARALSGGTVDRASAEVFVHAIRAPVSLPEEWGWRWEPGRDPETSAHLALKIASRTRVEPDAASQLIFALSSWAAREARLQYLRDDVLLALAFGELTALAPIGYTLDELSSEQRSALSSLSHSPDTGSFLWRFGLALREDISGFLSGTGALWKPLDVETEQGGRRFHLVRLWREYMLGRVSEDEATRAIAENLEPAAALEAICGSARGILLMRASDARFRRAEADELRDTALLVRVVTAYAERGFDVADMLARMTDTRSNWDQTTLGRAILCAHRCRGSRPRDADAKHIAWANRFSAPSSPVHAWFAELDAPLRALCEGHFKK